MKTSVENTGGLGRKLSIEIPADQVTSAFDRMYKGIQQNATVKGFRKGKAPMQLIKSMYSDRVKHDVLNDLISKAYSNALDEHDLRPVEEPTLNFQSGLEEEQPFSFTAEFEIRPTVEVKKFEKLKVEKEKLEVDESRIETVITQIRESRAETTPILEDRGAVEGDIAEIDFNGFVNEAPLEGGSAQGYKIQIGSNSLIPGFEEGLVGMKPGQSRTLNLKFPDDYHAEQLKGQPVRFEVTLKNLHKKSLPELNDEFAKSLGGFETMAALRETIRKDIEAEESKRIQDDLKARLMRALVKENPIEVPQVLLGRQKDVVIQDVEKRLKQQGMSDSEFEEYKKKWDNDFADTAAFMIKSSFLIEALAEKHKLEPSDKDIQERLEKYAAQSGIELAKIREFYGGNSARARQLEFQLMEEKVVEFLLQSADVKEVDKSKLENAEK